MVTGILSRFAQFIDYDLRRPVHRIAHPQVNNIDILTAFFQFQRIQPPKQIRRQAFNP